MAWFDVGAGLAAVGDTVAKVGAFGLMETMRGQLDKQRMELAAEIAEKRDAGDREYRTGEREAAQTFTAQQEKDRWDREKIYKDADLEANRTKIGIAKDEHSRKKQAADEIRGAGGGTRSDEEIIGQIEGSGDYNAVGPKANKEGDRAYGKYGVMGANVGPWTKEILGKELTPQEFLADKDAQDTVFRTKFGQYKEKHGSGEAAARAWFAGEGGMNNPNAKDVLGTSVSGYSRMYTEGGGGSGSPSDTAFQKAYKAVALYDPAAAARLLAEREERINARADRANTGGKFERQDDGTGYVINQNTGKVTLVVDADGKPVQFGRGPELTRALAEARRGVELQLKSSQADRARALAPLDAQLKEYLRTSVGNPKDPNVVATKKEIEAVQAEFGPIIKDLNEQLAAFTRELTGKSRKPGDRSDLSGGWRTE